MLNVYCISANASMPAVISVFMKILSPRKAETQFLSGRLSLCIMSSVIKILNSVVLGVVNSYNEGKGMPPAAQSQLPNMKYCMYNSRSS